MTNEDIVARLDRISAILRLAHYGEIERARESIRADNLNAAILDTATGWTPAGELTKSVQKLEKGQSPRTISRRIAALVDQGALERTGATAATKYRATGLV